MTHSSPLPRRRFFRPDAEKEVSSPGLMKIRCYQSVSTLKKLKREAAAQRRPAKCEREKRFFSAKRQAVWFETRSISD